MSTTTIHEPRTVASQPIVERTVATADFRAGEAGPSPSSHDQVGQSVTSPIQRAASDDPSTTETTVLVVDHHRSFADLLARALNVVAGMRCVGTAATAPEGIAFAAELQPGIVVLDIQMPGQDGLHAIRRIRQAAPNTAVAVVTANCEPVWISRAAQAGASAFILKDGSLIEMMDVLRRVRHGQLIVAPAAFRRGPSTTNRSLANVPTLTPRELEVLTYLGRAMPAVGIARVLGITVNTCRGHLKALHSKLGAASQLEAVIKAQQMGLITTS